MTLNDISPAQMRVLWHLNQGWELRQIFKVDDSIHWTMCLMEGVLAKKSFRILPATAIKLGIGLDLIESNGHLYNDCYRKFTLTDEGAELAKLVRRMDFE